MKSLRTLKLATLLFVSALRTPHAALADDGYTMLCDSNGVALPGFYFPSTNITGLVPAGNMPTNWVTFQTFQTGTNTVATNAASQLLAASNVLAAADAFNTNWVTTNLQTRLNTASNYLATNFLSQLTTTSNALSTSLLGQINTSSNYLSTNFLSQLTTTSNGLSILWNYNLNTVSNGLQVQVTSNATAIVTASNALAARIIATNTALLSVIATTSNTFAASIGPAKAFSCSVPATYSSIGIGFNAPLMPDGNFSVVLLPQDQTTAEAPSQGLFWWVGSKTTSGFTIYVSYATNAYNLNFECLVKENTQ